MQVLVGVFVLFALGALYGMFRYGGWNFSIHSANVVFIYIFLLCSVTALWSWIAWKDMEQEEDGKGTGSTWLSQGKQVVRRMSSVAAKKRQAQRPQKGSKSKGNIRRKRS